MDAKWVQIDLFSYRPKPRPMPAPPRQAAPSPVPLGASCASRHEWIGSIDAVNRSLGLTKRRRRTFRYGVITTSIGPGSSIGTELGTT